MARAPGSPSIPNMTPSAAVDVDRWTAPPPRIIDGRTVGWDAGALIGTRIDDDVVILGYD